MARITPSSSPGRRAAFASCTQLRDGFSSRRSNDRCSRSGNGCDDPRNASVSDAPYQYGLSELPKGDPCDGYCRPEASHKRDHGCQFHSLQQLPIRHHPYFEETAADEKTTIDRDERCCCQEWRHPRARRKKGNEQLDGSVRLEID